MPWRKIRRYFGAFLTVTAVVSLIALPTAIASWFKFIEGLDSTWAYGVAYASLLVIGLILIVQTGPRPAMPAEEDAGKAVTAPLPRFGPGRPLVTPEGDAVRFIDPTSGSGTFPTPRPVPEMSKQRLVAELRKEYAAGEVLRGKVRVVALEHEDAAWQTRVESLLGDRADLLDRFFTNPSVSLTRIISGIGGVHESPQYIRMDNRLKSLSTVLAMVTQEMGNVALGGARVRLPTHTSAPPDATITQSDGALGWIESHGVLVTAVATLVAATIVAVVTSAH